MSAATIDPTSPIAGDALDQALNWFVVLSSGEVTRQEREDFAHWLQADAGHRQYWEVVSGFQSALQGIPAQAAGQALRHAARKSARISRRHVLGLLGVAAIGALCYDRRGEWGVLMADQRTAVGEQRELTLPDGSRVVMDTDTALDIRFDDRRRRVVLKRGAVMIETAHADAWREQPFVVDTAQGRVRALGTRFVVRQARPPGWFGRGGLTRVEVMEGAVRICPQDGVDEGFVLPAGKQALFDGAGVAQVEALDPNGQAWAQGMLVVRDRPLGELVAELARYRPGVLSVDERAAAIRITGVFPLDDSERILGALERAFPIRVERHTRYWVNLAAAPEKKSTQP
ncbi:FecR domain-containing protein [Herbaspirillum sp. LeCh32-8]|uniref:FecR domain-containing protein n=1 Tax=Herbaspirillum sp. LeCh32-8 TaxID=2821356 RepID=UPI001AE5E29E|nr:FecR domain-containing protein [Herbaspirillum sp. LeCh32-8]MBP0597151.1 FecR domain-containing protein [Herbaspirillum sp. LeCh32-8]